MVAEKQLDDQEHYQLLSLLEVHGEGLLTEHSFASLQEHSRQGKVLCVDSRHVDHLKIPLTPEKLLDEHLDFRILGQFGIGSISPGNPVLGGELLGGGEAAGGTGHHLANYINLSLFEPGKDSLLSGH